MAIKLTPELYRQLMNEEEQRDELKEARAELVREKIKTEKARREKITESRKPKAESQPEKISGSALAMLFVLLSGLANVALLVALFFMF